VNVFAVNVANAANANNCSELDLILKTFKPKDERILNTLRWQNLVMRSPAEREIEGSNPSLSFFNATGG
jgi:hypothetical protein